MKLSPDYFLLIFFSIILDVNLGFTFGGSSLIQNLSLVKGALSHRQVSPPSLLRSHPLKSHKQ